MTGRLFAVGVLVVIPVSACSAAVVGQERPNGPGVAAHDEANTAS
jgi:hypothetical protein